MKFILINVFCIGYTLAFVQNRGIRDDFNSKSVQFLSERDNLAAKAEMTPSPGCEEGDILMTDRQKEVYFTMREATAENRERVRRDAEAVFRIWPNKTLVYHYGESLGDSVKLVFERAIEIYREHTGIRFIEAFEDYAGSIHPLHVQGLATGCFSTVGYSDGSGGSMNLQTGLCESLGTVLHEIGHALGRFHEQTRSDRDEHVTVNEANILPGFEHNFRKADRPMIAPYDIQSIMHYAADAYSFDHHSETISPSNHKDVLKMGRQQRLSRVDVFTFNAAYGAFENCPEDLWDRCTRGGVPNKHCTCDCLPQFEGPYCEIFNLQTECSGIYQLEGSGVIRSPGFPDDYASNSECNYVIECAEDEIIQLDFSKFAIEGYDCFFDKMDMMTGDLTTEIYPDEYCDDFLDRQTVLSKRNTAVMKFVSDDMYNYPGYEIYFHCIPSSIVSK